MNVVGYIRVSTDAQADGLSPVTQESRIRDWCGAMGHELVAIHQDLGVSGSVTPRDRKGFSAAMKQIANCEADGIVALRFDRFTRTTKDLLVLAEEAQTEQFAICSVEQQLDTSTPMGQFVLTIFGAVAQLERQQVSERTLAAMAELRRQGRSPGRHTPFGKMTQDGGTENRAGDKRPLVNNPREQEILTTLEDLTERGCGPTVIAKRFSELGYVTRSGGPWTRQSVSRLQK